MIPNALLRRRCRQHRYNRPLSPSRQVARDEFVAEIRAQPHEIVQLGRPHLGEPRVLLRARGETLGRDDEQVGERAQTLERLRADETKN
jgi:hypothetical protein